MERSGLYEVVIVGGGVAGSAAATVLARAGLSVLLLEKSLVHRDRVRGEFMPPWGVAEVKALGLLETLLDAGAHFTRRDVPYGEDLRPDQAEQEQMSLGDLLPGIEGGLTLGHPQICDALNASAAAAGAVLLRGVSDILVTPGDPPRVSFVHEQEEKVVRPRLVIGADGRGSAVARQIGAKRQEDQVHHLIAGMLVGGAEDWPSDMQVLGTEGERAFYIFPQGNGRLRLYTAYPIAHRRIYLGAGAEGNFLEQFRLNSVPRSDALVQARPIGPCQSYPNGDCRLDRIDAPGVVLIGDAAGHNDPTIGQGLSISFRDVRLVTETIVAGGADRRRFTPFAEERQERLRRLRFSAQLFSHLRVEFGEEARGRRRAARETCLRDPSAALPFAATLVGPHNVPPEAFTEQAWLRLLPSPRTQAPSVHAALAPVAG